MKDLAGKTFLNASIGEAGKNAFPAGADSQNEPRAPRYIQPTTERGFRKQLQLAGKHSLEIFGFRNRWVNRVVRALGALLHHA